MNLRVIICTSMQALLITAAAVAACSNAGRADPDDVEQVAHGRQVYAAHCASCHGANLEGQPNWRERLPNGRLPSPPHDAQGHTWHHSDTLLFDIVKNGMERHAPPGYQSDMPAFGGRLSDDDIWAALAYIKSSWPEQTRKWQAQINAR